MTTFDPDPQAFVLLPVNEVQALRELVTALQGVRKELGLIRESLEAIHKDQRRAGLRRPNWPPDPPHARSRR